MKCHVNKLRVNLHVMCIYSVYIVHIHVSHTFLETFIYQYVLYFAKVYYIDAEKLFVTRSQDVFLCADIYRDSK